MLFSISAFSQVGINTDTPKATLDIVATPSDLTKTDGFIAPRILGNDLASKDALYTSAQTGAIVYATAAVSTPTAKTTNVTSVGYYYFDGTVWVKMTPATVTADNGLTKTGNNIQLGGTLLKNTEIITAGFNTSFSGTGNVGVGTNVPSERLDVGTGNVRIRDINGIAGNATTDKTVVADANGVLKTIPKQTAVLSGGSLADDIPTSSTLTTPANDNSLLAQSIRTVNFTVTSASLVTFDYQVGYAIPTINTLSDGRVRTVGCDLRFVSSATPTIPVGVSFAADWTHLTVANTIGNLPGSYFLNGSQTLRLEPGNYSINVLGIVRNTGDSTVPFSVIFAGTTLDHLTITAQSIQ